MKGVDVEQLSLLNDLEVVSQTIASYPRFRYMGSKFRLLPWLTEAFDALEFNSVTDAFSGSGGVSYLLKQLGKTVQTNDALHFPFTLAQATVANSSELLNDDDLALLLQARAKRVKEKFIERTFGGIFYTPKELQFLDDVWCGIRQLESPNKRALAVAAILRSAVKRQPRGLFTVAGDPERYKDGRRDLQLTLREHFVEQVEVYNAAVFSNGADHSSRCGDVFTLPQGSDLVYMDPPYVPTADDNCYMKRYHFLEGLSCYWEDQEIMMNTKVRKIVKPFTPFAYRRTAVDAFDRLFRHFADSKLVLSYSTNAWPDLDTLRELMGRYKKNVDVLERDHRYTFGNHEQVRRNDVKELLIIGTD